MKIALTCDHLLSDDLFTQSLASILEIFPEAPIYTLAHQRGSIPTALQEKTIHASYLSHKVTSPEQLVSRYWAIPRAAANLAIPCNTDFIFSFSAGLGHGFNKCKKTYQFTYLYRNDIPKRGFFSSYIRHWSQKKLKQCQYLRTAIDSLATELRSHHPQIKTLNPGFKVECFLRPQPLEQPTFCAVEGVITPQLESILRQSGQSWKPLDSAQTLKDSHALLSPEESDQIPARALESLALGNIVIIKDTPLNRHILGPLENCGVTFITDICEIPSALECASLPVNPTPLRSFALKYGESRFKSALRQDIKDIFDNHLSSSRMDS